MLLSPTMALSEDELVLARMVDEGLLVYCDHQSSDDDFTQRRDGPCGFQHRGDGFYHLAPDKTMEDVDRWFEVNEA